MAKKKLVITEEEVKEGVDRLYRAFDELTTIEYTKSGQPRKRAPGAGRPPTVGAPSDPLVKISARLPGSQQAWLAAQPHGPSATLRRLIAEAMQQEPS